MLLENETLEEWIKRIGEEPIWREVGMLINYEVIDLTRKKTVREAIKAFTKDLFSLRWDAVPSEATVLLSYDAIEHANIAIISARKQVTRKCPPKEKLWTALRKMYEECKSLRSSNDFLREKIRELEEYIEEHKECV